jgi:hypothetical protein
MMAARERLTELLTQARTGLDRALALLAAAEPGSDEWEALADLIVQIHSRDLARALNAICEAEEQSGHAWLRGQLDGLGEGENVLGEEGA